MKKLLFLLLTIGLLSFANEAFAQGPDSAVSEKDSIIEFPDIEPVFTGGEAAMQSFVYRTIVYPVEAIEQNIQGKVKVQFVVEKDGTITDIGIYESAGEILDKEAMRVVSEMPNWVPGKNEERTVRVRCIVPISFTISNYEPPTREEKKKKPPNSDGLR